MKEGILRSFECPSDPSRPRRNPFIQNLERAILVPERCEDQGLAGISAARLPLSSNLGGVTVAVTPGNGGSTLSAYPTYVSAGQINAILPNSTPVGLDNVTVSFNDVSSQPAPIQVVKSSFGIFTANFGSGPAAVIDLSTSDPIPSSTNPARPGDILELFGTGLERRKHARQRCSRRRHIAAGPHGAGGCRRPNHNPSLCGAFAAVPSRRSGQFSASTRRRRRGRLFRIRLRRGKWGHKQYRDTADRE